MSEPVDELAARRAFRARTGLSADEILRMWDFLGEAIDWSRSAEDAVERIDYSCMVCEANVREGEHRFDCVGFTLREARRANEAARHALELEFQIRDL